MTKFYAQPYDISACGFYFETIEEFNTQIAQSVNDYGDPVEEFEIQFIDGTCIDAKLYQAIGINQCNIGAFIEAIDHLSDDQKIKIIIATGECGYSFDLEKDQVDDFDIDIYEIDTLRELAEQFVDEGLFGEIPPHLEHYIDYNAIAHDLGMEYSEIEIAGNRYIYRAS